MLKIKDANGKVIGVLKDEDSEPTIDEETREYWAKVQALLDSGEAHSKSEAKRLVAQRIKTGE